MPDTISRGTTVVDNSSQGLKERGSAMDLINDNELADLGAEKGVRILETPSINWALKVKV